MVECKITCEALPKISLIIDGVDVSNKVYWFELSCRGGEVPQLKVSMLPDKLDVSLPCEMEMVTKDA